MTTIKNETKAGRGAKPTVNKRKGATSASKSKSGHRWVASVQTVSTFPPKGLFTRDASTIAHNLASKKTSPKGPASGMRMLNYYINRAGHNLSPSRKAELKRAKSILSDIIARRRNTRAK